MNGLQSKPDDTKVISSVDEIRKVIRFALMDLLARREHSRSELFTKLKTRFDPELLDEQISRLTEEGLQSDQRFAEAYVRSRISKSHGPQRIRFDMKNKGLSDLIIESVLSEYDQEFWASLAKELAARRFGEVKADTPKERAKRFRFMQYRGFNSDLVSRIV